MGTHMGMGDGEIWRNVVIEIHGPFAIVRVNFVD